MNVKCLRQIGRHGTCGRLGRWIRSYTLGRRVLHWGECPVHGKITGIPYSS